MSWCNMGGGGGSSSSKSSFSSEVYGDEEGDVCGVVSLEMYIEVDDGENFEGENDDSSKVALFAPLGKFVDAGDSVGVGLAEDGGIDGMNDDAVVGRLVE